MFSINLGADTMSSESKESIAGDQPRSTATENKDQIRIKALETELQKKDDSLAELQAAKMICIVIIVVLMILFVPIAILKWRSSRGTKINRVNQMQQDAQRRPSTQKLSKCDDVAIAEMKNEGIDTNIGRWQPERFRDLLGNSKMVQDILVDDIVHHMQTEGLEGSVV